MRAFCDIYNKNVNYAQFNKYVAFDESHDSVRFNIDYNVLNTKLIHLIISPFLTYRFHAMIVRCSRCVSNLCYLWPIIRKSLNEHSSYLTCHLSFLYPCLFTNNILLSSSTVGYLFLSKKCDNNAINIPMLEI